MNVQYSIGSLSVSSDLVYERLEQLAGAKKGTHWIRSDLQIRRFSWISRILWAVSKIFPLIRNCFRAISPQNSALLLNSLKVQIIRNDDDKLAGLFNKAVAAQHSIMGKKASGVSPIQAVVDTRSGERKTAEDDLSGKVLSYDDSTSPVVKTVGFLYDAAEALREKRKHVPTVHDQGIALGKKYYFQPCRGEGNCFYLGFASGWLHHLLRQSKIQSGSVQDSIELLCKFPNQHTKSAIQGLQKLQDHPSVEQLYQLLHDEEFMGHMTFCLRCIAVDGISTMEDPHQPGKLLWDDDVLKYYISQDEELSVKIPESMTPQDRRTLYCENQVQSGVEVQPMEIAVLHRRICPIAICGSQDHPNPAERGFIHDYKEGSPIVLFHWTNHYDALIPKSSDSL